MTSEQDYVERVYRQKTGEALIISEEKPIRVDNIMPLRLPSNVYAELSWNSDGTLSSLKIADKILHFIWNADGTLHSIRKG